MAHEKYTGKDMVTNFGTLAPVAGVQKVTIKQTFAPRAKAIDTTVAGDSEYQRTPDPLGGKGSAKCVVTIETLLSRADRGDSGVLSLAMNSEATLTVLPTPAGDKFTLTGKLQSREGTREIRRFVVQRFTVESASSAGAWSTIA